MFAYELSGSGFKSGCSHLISYMSNDEFISINKMLKECDEIKEKIRNPLKKLVIQNES